MSGDNTIGEALRRIRRERSLTQSELAERAEVSRDLVAKLEQGSRQSARLTSLAKLATALDVPVSELTGRRPRLDGRRGGPSVLAIRDVLLSSSHLPGFAAYEYEYEGGEPMPPDDLRAAVAEAARMYWAGKFPDLATALPGLIMEARLTRRESGADAATPLALAYDLAASLMVHMGKEDLAAIGAERAIVAAAEGDDRLLHATLHATFAWTLLHQGRLEEAENIAARVAAGVEPSFSGPTHDIAVWGNLLMTALAPAAAAGRDVSEYISLASAAAGRIGQRVKIYQTSFGPATVQMQATHAYAVRREPSLALEAARKIGPDDLQGISRGRHLLDVAQAHVDARHRKTAVSALLEARAVSPVWFRHQGVARSLVAGIREHEQRLSPVIRDLARSVDLGGKDGFTREPAARLV